MEDDTEVDVFGVDPDKEVNTRKFLRRGGTRRTQPNGRRCHAHSGSGCNHDTAEGFDNMTAQEHKAHIERKAAHFGCDLAGILADIKLEE